MRAMAEAAPSASQATAIGLLRELLLRGDLPYRMKWLRHSRHAADGKINSLAVARYLAEERRMWGMRGNAWSAKDTVGRALAAEPSRQLLTPDTLTRFIDGFGFSDAEAHRLRALLAGAVQAVADRSYRTVSLHEFHYVGPDGLPERHQTIQVVRADVDGFTSYPYRFDTDHARVTVSRGGRIVERQWVDGTLYEVVIRLTRPLQRDELTVMQYDTYFSYDGSDPPPAEFRRAATRRTENLDMYLQFHRARPPRAVWWARWADYRPGADILDQERAPLDANLSVWRYLPSVERAVVGFHWAFD